MSIARLFTSPLYNSQLLTNRDGVSAWRRFHGDQQTRLGDGESLVLDITDFYTPGAEQVVTLWARTNGFSLEGIDPNQALTALLWTTVNSAVYEAPDHDEILNALSLWREGASPVVPDFRIIIGGSYIAARLIEAFDRPRTDEENRAAFNRRTSGRYA